jgi:hypothetical protein
MRALLLLNRIVYFRYFDDFLRLLISSFSYFSLQPSSFHCFTDFHHQPDDIDVISSERQLMLAMPDYRQPDTPLRYAAAFLQRRRCRCRRR